MVAGVIDRHKPVWPLRVAHRFVKVDYGVEMAGRPDPSIYGLAVGFA